MFNLRIYSPLLCTALPSRLLWTKPKLTFAKRPVAIAPLLVENPEERRLFDLGEKNSKAKKALAKTGLRKQTPNDEESDLIHAMWLKQLDYHGMYFGSMTIDPQHLTLPCCLKPTNLPLIDPNIPTRRPSNVVYMDSTVIHSTQIMQPQYRNRHNFMIFGGFLLKQTFELAFCCVSSFSHSRPTFVSLDPSTFENPVPVGSVLYLEAFVAYTDSPSVTSAQQDGGGSDNNYTRVQIRVNSKVRNIEHGEVKPTGQFSYTFLVEKDIRVMPKTYSEFMVWLDARRRAEQVGASVGELGGTRQDDGMKERMTEWGGKSRNGVPFWISQSLYYEELPIDTVLPCFVAASCTQRRKSMGPVFMRTFLDHFCPPISSFWPFHPPPPPPSLSCSLASSPHIHLVSSSPNQHPFPLISFTSSSTVLYLCYTPSIFSFLMHICLMSLMQNPVISLFSVLSLLHNKSNSVNIDVEKGAMQSVRLIVMKVIAERWENIHTVISFIFHIFF